MTTPVKADYYSRLDNPGKKVEPIFHRMLTATDGKYGRLTTNADTVYAAMYEIVREWDEKQIEESN